MRRAGLTLGMSVAVLVAIALAAPPLARLAARGAMSAVPRPVEPIDIGAGLSLNVSERPGTGRAIVLVHGLPSTLDDWDELPARLAAGDHRVIAYDRIGYGHSSHGRNAADHSLAANAGHLGALLDRLDVERPVLVGWSHGGGIVQHFAVARPERIAGVILLASVGPALAAEPLDPLDRLARSAIGPSLFRWIVAVPPIAAPVVEAAIEDAFSSASAVPRGWTARSVAQLSLPGVIDTWLAEERLDEYGALTPERITVPALIIHGDDDRAVPAAVAHDLAQRMPQAELVLIHGGPHMLPATHATQLASTISRWTEDR